MSVTNRSAYPYREHIIANGKRPGNEVRVVVHDVNDLLGTYDQIKVFRGNGQSGPFVEITGVGTRPVLLENVTEYTYSDLTGVAGSWYRIAYFDSVGVVDSPLSAPLPGKQSLALQLLSVDTMKNVILAGIRQTTPDGVALPDSFYEFHIRNAVAAVAARTDLPILPVQKTDVQAERVDYFRRDVEAYFQVKVAEYPIIAVHAFSLVLPNEVKVIDFDPAWMQVYSRAGLIKVIPGIGGVSIPLIGGGPAWALFAYGSPDFIPQMLRVSYTAGFPEFPDIDPLIVETVGKRAAIDVLLQVGELLYRPGVVGQKVNVDGLSTETRLAGAGPFASRVARYQADVDANCSVLRSRYKGIQMTVA